MDDLIDNLPNTSAITKHRFESLGIKKYSDLLNYFPFRYEDYSLISKIKNLQEGETATVTGKIVDSKYQVTRSRLKIQAFKITDETGEIEFSFFNQPYLLRLIKKGMTVSIAGNVQLFGRKLIIAPKEFELGPPLKHTGKIIPVYSEKKGLSSKTIREKMVFVLEKIISDVQEFLPKKIVEFNGLLDERKAYKQIHYPENQELIKKSRERLGFDELFTIQLSSYLVKKEWQKEKVGYKFKADDKTVESIKDFIDNLPFKLTNAQIKVWQEIFNDLKKVEPMNRFLQGEVGSGKTVVAALACYFAYLNGYKSILMAPTEILANQHYQTIINLFKKTPLKIGIQTGSKKITGNDDNIIVGTQALISKNFNLEKIGLVIIDEQHRFGVSQRALLKKKGINPHLLTMTATPIPRTVALTLYGELDISVIDEMPIGRIPVKTFYVPKIKREAGYEWIKSQIKKNRAQVFIVCPLIEESEIETMKTVKAAKKEFENLKNVFSGYKLNLLHGKLKPKEKEKIMIDFKNQKFDILVTTPVVEVGVDIPKATVMLIEGAERFGLAQLHQLRGRVGRNNIQSYCFLFSEKEEKIISNRLSFFAKTSDGNKLAEEDLKIRGAGDIFGTRQHGYLDLKIASLSDFELIEKTKNAVNYFNSHFKLGDYPFLKNRIGRLDENISQD